MEISIYTGANADISVWKGDSDTLIMTDRFGPNWRGKVACMKPGDSFNARDVDGDIWFIQASPPSKCVAVTFRDFTDGAVNAWTRGKTFKSREMYDLWILENALTDRDIIILNVEEGLSDEEARMFMYGK